MASSLGPWSPLGLDEAIELFRPSPFSWWISGGHALELHLGTSWRTHGDTDVSFRRIDAPKVLDVLAGWDIHIAAGGTLSKWNGQPLTQEARQNNLWARPTPESDWVLDLTISDGDDDQWIYRRDPSLTRPWNKAVLQTRTGRIPYLSPELQLLYKSTSGRTKDQQDASVVIPRLTPEQAQWLSTNLPDDHRWQRLL